MTDLSTRSNEKEYIDRTDIPFTDIEQNLKELDFINTWLGGHTITIRGFKKLLNDRKEVSVCEVGCGGGDNLNAIIRYCKKQNISVSVSGIDINTDCIAYAEKNINAPATFITSDYRDVQFRENPDIIFTSLFCHHFGNEELVNMMQWMKANSRVGFFINDLHRHPIAWHFIKYASQLFSHSWLVKNDAPLSVSKGFKRKEWEDVFQKAGIEKYSIQWKWAFRHLVVYRNE